MLRTSNRLLRSFGKKGFFAQSQSWKTIPTRGINSIPPQSTRSFANPAIDSNSSSSNLKTSLQFFTSHQSLSDCQAILESLVSHLNLDSEKPFQDVMIVAVQHILGTTIDMFKVFKDLGLESAIVGGKSYSTHKESVQELRQLGYTFVEAPDQLGYGRFDGCMQETVNRIWQIALEAMKKKPAKLLIILDDGGDLILSTPGKLFNGISYKPKRVVGIEQTRGGSNHPCINGLPFPIIHVAGSFVKTAIEYPSVADIAATKVLRTVQSKLGSKFVTKPIVGVVGNGTMGQAVTKAFREKGFKVLVHDENPHKNYEERQIYWRPTLPPLISDADIIIGCTGTDITAKTHVLSTILNSIKKNLFLVSVSSKDVEFNDLLKHIQEKTKKLEKTPDPLADIEYTSKEEDSPTIYILNGGFPINFDNQKHSVPPEKIWPTRAALLSACLMAVEAYNKQLLNTPDLLKLDAVAQQFILKKYAELNPNNPVVLKTKGMQEDTLRAYISTNSEGNALEVFSEPTNSITATTYI